jgi:hypothetical protein
MDDDDDNLDLLLKIESDMETEKTQDMLNDLQAFEEQMLNNYLRQLYCDDDVGVPTASGAYNTI